MTQGLPVIRLMGLNYHDRGPQTLLCRRGSCYSRSAENERGTRVLYRRARRSDIPAVAEIRAGDGYGRAGAKEDPCQNRKSQSETKHPSINADPANGWQFRRAERYKQTQSPRCKQQANPSSCERQLGAFNHELTRQPPAPGP